MEHEQITSRGHLRRVSMPVISLLICNHNTCINWKEGRCSLKDPEKEDDSCLYYEDVMNSFRLKADALKGTLG